MTTARDILEPHLDAALAEAAEKKMSTDAVARILFEQAIRIWKETRAPEDTAPSFSKRRTIWTRMKTLCSCALRWRGMFMRP